MHGDLDLQELRQGVEITSASIADYRPGGGGNVAALFYQSGYLTIGGYDKKTGLYKLVFPNEEVRFGFFNELLPYYTSPYKDVNNSFQISRFFVALRDSKVDDFMEMLIALFESIPYDIQNKNEKYYQGLFYMFFTLMGQFTQSEQKSAHGRACAVVKTDSAIYVFEFKFSTDKKKHTALEALKQIDTKGYLIPFTADKRKLVKIGVVFSDKNMGKWKAVESKVKAKAVVAQRKKT